MPAPDVDVAILGGGCAGLSLAVRLAQSNLTVRVIEPRTEYVDDRAWSFWRTRPDPFDDCVRKEWTSWTVQDQRGQTLRTSSHMRYQTVTSGAFYRRACEMIDKSKKSSLSLGVAAHDIARNGREWQIETDAGALTATTIVDTRPPRRKPTYGQFFLGREIKTERPVFEPDTVQLMHFRRARSKGVDFVYILPFAVDQALVEVTSFAPVNPGHAVFTDWLDTEIDALNPGKTETIRTEAGALPMEVGFAEAAPEGIIRMGLGGGAARPSTGYAFSRNQMQADRVAAALINGKLPNVDLDGPMTRFMDRVFLQVLTSKPERGPALFDTLFRNAPKDRLERFLSGSTKTADRVSVMASLPPLPFLQAAAFPK
ncbi:lycopene cyclase family protein [Sulfitobacter guttiformis]|jgi:lycopene beta-cyclase|uniref:Lycopene beta-cyclase n=1 Tax=Sulfitobacter guttiformis TaxID=74349 RepID=A0A420DPQ6_9RHOB|nr:lycopene cyclase family protein [Sulfitobacter guttiformis]KIN73518.1 Lycopene beta cyclase [Sulfitobacter guttiformis KCTC 32187]RKE96170.1 lycopene beta-cyclase [Sulfitobacter guttiformis]